MSTLALAWWLSVAASAADLGAGDHSLGFELDGWERTYHVHVPSAYDATKPTPLVLAFHGAAMDGKRMIAFCALNETSDREKFIVVYPDGTGLGPFRTWNAGGFGADFEQRKPDDVKFVGRLIDDLQSKWNVDSRRVYATGLSNGGMMCHRLACHLSDRIAAFAPVAGTIATEPRKPSRFVPILHFHGTADTIVPYGGVPADKPAVIRFKSVDDTIKTWCEFNNCEMEPKLLKEASREEDGTSVERFERRGSSHDAVVVLVKINGGGHTWPGGPNALAFLGKTTKNISANDTMWRFFLEHPLAATK